MLPDSDVATVSTLKEVPPQMRPPARITSSTRSTSRFLQGGPSRKRSRLFYHGNGTDGTAFPNQRAVMVKLLPSRAQSHNVTPLGGNEFRVSYEKIPGFIPAEATGVFAGFYPAYRPYFEGQDPRPDRFGFLSIAYDYTTVP